jgi:hypothetical protein
MKQGFHVLITNLPGKCVGLYGEGKREDARNEMEIAV